MEQQHNRTGRMLTIKKVPFHILLTCTVAGLISFEVNHVTFATPTAQITPDQANVTLEFEKSEYGMERNFPLYEQGPIRYFSAGVGKAERKPQYPAFPLKLIFANDTGSFLAFISVEIRHQDGSLAADIPAKHVTGPWLFVDLEPGVYEIVATNKNGQKVTKHVPIKKDDPLSLPLYWNS
ncbi:hypothetical protein [Candidatus Nitronereus thalassa]|uniref:Carboxypeptidase regulatory-like domain-containing protein n=1 Tax=Candidatus Nitronereus thalassa TaxID=3020898 RepID=A0ABU3KB70_9BACT|nr:hypothetical protein [Candidatus Nitronereus thalassa]MDT7043739.1 hypothetical protein [Candidatus Nitronereus thalassa]